MNTEDNKGKVTELHPESKDPQPRPKIDALELEELNGAVGASNTAMNAIAQSARLLRALESQFESQKADAEKKYNDSFAAAERAEATQNAIVQRLFKKYGLPQDANISLATGEIFKAGETPT